MPKPRYIVVKVQVSLATSDETRRMLIYDQFRKICFEGPINSVVSEMMGDSPKKFFRAKVTANEIQLLKPVTWREW